MYLLPHELPELTGTLILRSYGGSEDKILDRNMQSYEVFDIIDVKEAGAKPSTSFSF